MVTENLTLIDLNNKENLLVHTNANSSRWENFAVDLIPWIKSITKDLMSFCQICFPKCELHHKFDFLLGSKRAVALEGSTSATPHCPKEKTKSACYPSQKSKEQNQNQNLLPYTSTNILYHFIYLNWANGPFLNNLLDRRMVCIHWLWPG